MGWSVPESPPKKSKEGSGRWMGGTAVRYLIGGAVLAVCGLVMAVAAQLLLKTDTGSVTWSADLRMMEVAGCALAAAGLLVVVLMLREQMENKKKESERNESWTRKRRSQ